MVWWWVLLQRAALAWGVGFCDPASCDNTISKAWLPYPVCWVSFHADVRNMEGGGSSMGPLWGIHFGMKLTGFLYQVCPFLAYDPGKIL